MTPFIHVKPKPVSDAPDAPLHRVRLPSPRAAELLPDEGITTEDSSFWRRRAEDGEVEISEGVDGRDFTRPEPGPQPQSKARGRRGQEQ